MKKIIKIFLLSFIIFNLNNIVYAADQCYYMPGKNNTVIVPKGFTAICDYKYDSTQSNTQTSGGTCIMGQCTEETRVRIMFSLDRVLLGFVNTSDVTSFDGDAFLSLELSENLRPSLYNPNQEVNLDGLHLTEKNGYNGYFHNTVYDSNINGCPNSIYWVDDTTTTNTKYFGFSASSTPNLTIDATKSKYAVYKLDQEETYDEIAFVSNKGDDIIWEYTTDPSNKEYYEQKISECNNDILRYDSTGYGTPPTPPNSTKSEILKSCSYYFGLNSFDDTCNLQQITFTYQKKTQGDKSSLTVTTTYSGNQEQFLSNVQEKINLVNLDDPNTYTNLNDYLVYKDGNWSCANQIYIWKNPNGQNTVFGASKYQTFLNFYGKEEIAESSNDKNQNLCPAGSNSGSNSPIDWGDPVEKNCEGILGQDLLDFINKIFRWIQILAPIFVIIMGGIDFAGAILQDDKDALKKASSKFIKRLIIAVALFFIPLILSFILNIFNDITGAGSSICEIGG